jgi:tetratricopeptide (TPR) repeat protein
LSTGWFGRNHCGGLELKLNAGRNDPCPCGSGKKYKICCGQLRSAQPGAATSASAAIEPARADEVARLGALLDAQRYAELESSARELLALQPTSGILWQLLGAALRGQGKDALPALESAARCMPQDAAALLNWGNALGRAGRLEDARLSYGRALALRPDFAEAHHNLADVELELGCIEEAIASCRRALKVKPNFAEAHQRLGIALARLGRFEEAIASFRDALAVRADFVEAQVNLAAAQRRIGRLDEAIAGYRRALQLRPDLVAAHTELATALRLQSRGIEAQACCRDALAIDPNSSAALGILAELCADSGRFAEAEQLYERVIAIEPESTEAWAGIAHLRRMTSGDSAWLLAATRLAERDLPPRRELVLRYAVGKYYDDVQDYEMAFANYRRANELDRRCGPGHDRNALARNIDLIIRSHDRRWVDRMRRSSDASARPVFIVGMLRSGTTLAEQILGSHPAVFAAGELTFWGARGAAAITEAEARNEPELSIDEPTLANWGRDYLDLLRSLSPDAERVVNKWPTNFLFLGLLHAALPQARIIHMRRDPIDTCLSIYFQHFEAANTYATDLEDLAHTYREYLRLMRHWRSVLAPQSLLEVSYENLVADVEGETRRMLQFIAEPWDPRCLEFDTSRRSVVTASRWQVRQKIGASSVGRWRHYEKFIGPLKALREPDAATP